MSATLSSASASLSTMFTAHPYMKYAAIIGLVVVAYFAVQKLA